MEHEETFDASEHNEFLEFVLGFNSTTENIVAVIGENYNTNPAISPKIGPTVGHSLHFNLSVQEVFAEDEEILSAV